MKTKKFLLVIAIFGGVLFTAQATNIIDLDEQVTTNVEKSKIKPECGHIGPFPYNFSHFGADRCPQNIPAGYLQVNRMEHRRSASYS